MGYLLPRRGCWGEKMLGLMYSERKETYGNNENGELVYINNLIFL